MAVGTITVSARAIGRRKRLLEDWSIDLPPSTSGEDEGEPLTLRRVISRIVTETVELFRRRQESGRFIRVLMQQEIDARAATGKISSGGSDLNQKVDVDSAIANALQAFEDGLYLVIIDDVEYRDLDAEVYLSADSRVVFLRLVMLAGG